MVMKIEILTNWWAGPGLFLQLGLTVFLLQTLNKLGVQVVKIQLHSNTETLPSHLTGLLSGWNIFTVDATCYSHLVSREQVSNTHQGVLLPFLVIFMT